MAFSFRAIAWTSFEPEEFGAVSVGGGGDESSCFDTAFSFDRVESNQIERDVSEDGEVGRGGLGAGTHLIVIERDIHHPMRAVLHRPMSADGVKNTLRVWCQAADIHALFQGG